jgi:hypothetical protein
MLAGIFLSSGKCPEKEKFFASFFPPDLLFDHGKQRSGRLDSPAKPGNDEMGKFRLYPLAFRLFAFHL